MRYFVDSENAATPANTYHAWVLQWSPGGVPGHAEDERDAAAGQHRARRPHERAAPAERDRHLDDGAGEDGGEDLRHADLEAQLDLAEHVDRDDDGGDVQARVAQLGQHHRVRAALELERRGRHASIMVEAWRIVSGGS